ncbi:MAG: hypothetical protein MJZ83_04715 [Bacteroidaceae bacterium]|nr:hypothetical protein [Bacteroidaceae bacterium]
MRKIAFQLLTDEELRNALRIVVGGKEPYLSLLYPKKIEYISLLERFGMSIQKEFFSESRMKRHSRLNLIKVLQKFEEYFDMQYGEGSLYSFLRALEIYNVLRRYYQFIAAYKSKDEAIIDCLEFFFLTSSKGQCGKLENQILEFQRKDKDVFWGAICIFIARIGLYDPYIKKTKKDGYRLYLFFRSQVLPFFEGRETFPTQEEASFKLIKNWADLIYEAGDTIRYWSTGKVNGNIIFEYPIKDEMSYWVLENCEGLGRDNPIICVKCFTDVEPMYLIAVYSYELDCVPRLCREYSAFFCEQSDRLLMSLNNLPINKDKVYEVSFNKEYDILYVKSRISGNSILTLKRVTSDIKYKRLTIQIVHAIKPFFEEYVEQWPNRYFGQEGVHLIINGFNSQDEYVEFHIEDLSTKTRFKAVVKKDNFPLVNTIPINLKGVNIIKRITNSEEQFYIEGAGVSFPVQLELIE